MEKKKSFQVERVCRPQEKQVILLTPEPVLRRVLNLERSWLAIARRRGCTARRVHPVDFLDVAHLAGGNVLELQPRDRAVRLSWLDTGECACRRRNAGKLGVGDETEIDHVKGWSGRRREEVVARYGLGDSRLRKRGLGESGGGSGGKGGFDGGVGGDGGACAVVESCEGADGGGYRG